MSNENTSEILGSENTLTTTNQSPSRILQAALEKVARQSHFIAIANGNDPEVCADQECSCDVMCDGSDYSRTYFDKSLLVSDH